MQKKFREIFFQLESIAINTITNCKYKDLMDEVLIYVPSGDLKYYSFWVRDAAMMAESGLIDSEIILGWIKLIVYYGQNEDKTLILSNGLEVPPWSIADHINFDLTSVFFPGTYDSGVNQGDGSYGYYPPHDDQYYFIRMAKLYYDETKNIDFLNKEYNGTILFERLKNAFESYNIDKKTNLCYGNDIKYTVDWGFCDSIKKSGLLLYPSLLRYQAANDLKNLSLALGLQDEVKYYQNISYQIKENIIEKFYKKQGWFISATSSCNQFDVWGTAYAVWLGVYRVESLEIIVKNMIDAYENKTAVDNGYIRHICLDNDVKNSAWQQTHCLYNHYQNGGYWATATGWYAYAVWLKNPEIAIRLLEEFINHTKKFKEQGSPFEWKNIDESIQDGLKYGTSGSMPYAAVKRISLEI